MSILGNVVDEDKLMAAAAREFGPILNGVADKLLTQLPAELRALLEQYEVRVEFVKKKLPEA